MVVRQLVILIFFINYSTADVVEKNRNYLSREACAKNPHLVFCSPAVNPNIDDHESGIITSHDDSHVEHRKSIRSSNPSKKTLDLVVPPPLPASVRNKEQSDDDKTFGAFERQSLLDNEHDENAKLLSGENNDLRRKCIKFSPVVATNCQPKRIVKEHLGRCAAYFKDCAPYMAKADPLYDIANKFSSGVNLNLATVEVNGIPYYAINEEGGIGVGHQLGIPFGSWGGGFSQSVGVRDYWSQHQEAGANWYEGKYGYKNGWSVPLVESLGVEGGQHNTVSVPLHGKDFGRIDVDNGYHVGGYYGHNDHVGVDWKKGNVQHTFGVGVPFAGAGFMTGQAVAFPTLDTFLNAGKK